MIGTLTSVRGLSKLTGIVAGGSDYIYINKLDVLKYITRIDNGLNR